MGNKKIIIFDLWETLIFGTNDSAISIFYNEITGEKINGEILKKCMLIKQTQPRVFIEEFLNIVTPSNVSSMLLSLKNSRSPLYNKIIKRFLLAIENDSKELRWVPGAIELLNLLKKQYTLIVVSNLLAYQKKYLLEDLGINKYFDKNFFSCDIGLNKDQILLQIDELLNTAKEEIIFIGKSYEYDIIPAINANISAIKINSENNIIIPEKIKKMIDEESGNDKNNIYYKESKESKHENLIVIPPFYKLLGSHNNRINLSAAYLSAHLTEKGYKTNIYHCDFEDNEEYISRYQMVFNSIEFYERLENEKSYYEFEEFYKKNRFDTVFVTCGDILNPSFDSGNWDSSQKIARIIRKINPSAYIVAMGPEVGGESEDFDLLVYGEIEPLSEKIIRNKIRGKIQAPLLQQNHLKKYYLFDINNILTKVSPVSLDTIIWRRGCAGTCDFCRVAQINKGIIRYHPMDLILKEIKMRYETLQIRNFYIVDANFTADKQLTLKFCSILKQQFPDITWRTESRFDTLDIELLKQMKLAGCTHLKLGLENALHEKHQVKTKRIDLSTAVKWIKIIRDIGINCVIYLMLGGKWFTDKEYNMMYENVKLLNADAYTVSLFNPYPGTPAGISYEEWHKRKFIGSHLDIRLIDYWNIPIDIVDKFFELELSKGREDKNIRKFKK